MLAVRQIDGASAGRRSGGIVGIVEVVGNATFAGERRSAFTCLLPTLHRAAKVAVVGCDSLR